MVHGCLHTKCICALVLRSGMEFQDSRSLGSRNFGDRDFLLKID